MTLKYNVIYLDPPWPYNKRNNLDTLFGGGARGHYKVMSFEEIAALNVPAIAADDCAIFMWVTWPLSIEPALGYLFDGWGFRYRTLGFIWVKLNHLKLEHVFKKHHKMSKRELTTALWRTIFKGPGFYTQANTEPCLLAMRGQLQPVHKDVSQVVLWPRTKHSQKPPIVRDRIVRLFGDLPRVELFARERVEGWDGWGAEYPA